MKSKSYTVLLKYPDEICGDYPSGCEVWCGFIKGENIHEAVSAARAEALKEVEHCRADDLLTVGIFEGEQSDLTSEWQKGCAFNGATESEILCEKCLSDSPSHE